MSGHFIVAVSESVPVRMRSASPFSADFSAIKHVRIECSGVSPRHFFETMNAVCNQTGRKPTHFLVGRETWMEMRCGAMGARDQMYFGRRGDVYDTWTIDGIPIVPDPMRKSGVVAVPENEWLIGREMPKGAVWDPEAERVAEQEAMAASLRRTRYREAMAALDALIDRPATQEPETLEQRGQRLAKASR